jgi:hypothetical protein
MVASARWRALQLWTRTPSPVKPPGYACRRAQCQCVQGPSLHPHPSANVPYINAPGVLGEEYREHGTVNKYQEVRMASAMMGEI